MNSKKEEQFYSKRTSEELSSAVVSEALRIVWEIRLDESWLGGSRAALSEVIIERNQRAFEHCLYREGMGQIQCRANIMIILLLLAYILLFLHIL